MTDNDAYTQIIGPPDAADDAPLPPPGTRPALVWRPRLGEEHSFALADRTTTVGRNEENDIVLAAPTVSARHAVLRVERDAVVLEDEGSLNGTFVNGERVERVRLEAGDRVQIGPHLLLFVPAAAGG